MRRPIDIHDFAATIAKRLAHLEERGVPAENATAIRRFADQCYSEGLSPARVSKLVSLVVQLQKRRDLPLKRWTKDDVTAVVGDIERGSYTAWTKRDYKIALRKFFRWLRGAGDEYPPEVAWIRTASQRQCRTLPEELLTEADVMKMVEAAENPRDAAFIFVLYESGCRIGEIASLRIKHAEFDDYGACVRVTGKTGSRRVRLISSTPALAAWLGTHPLRDDPDAPVWIGLGVRNRYAPLNYGSIRALIQRVARRAGIKKRVHAHLFRHSRATHLANTLTEAQMKVHFGWVQASDMASTYVHLSGRDVDDALLRLNGLKAKDEKESLEALRPRNCPRCRSSNSAAAHYCSQCRMALDPEAAMARQERLDRADAVTSMLLKDPDIQALIEQKLQAMPSEISARRPGPVAAAGRA